MSALAKLMVLKGYSVSGSDIRYSAELEELGEWGAEIHLGSEPEAVKSADLVVFSGAIPATDPELLQAIASDKKRIRRDFLLREVSSDYDRVVAVAGTHGKTTVTAMLSSIFKEAGELYTAHIGGETFDAGNLSYRGDSCFITEACEYRRSFLALNPDIAVITEVEPDHPDTYRDERELFEAFEAFSSLVKEGGTVIINADAKFYRMRQTAYKKVFTYALESNADLRAVDMRILENGCYGFRIRQSGKPNSDITLSVPGRHNVYNALAAAAAARCYGIPDKYVSSGLKRFMGVHGRFEYLKPFRGAKLYADYAHHPTEIKAAIRTALGLRPKRLVVVFQPHTLSRTEMLMKEFTYSFCDADAVFFFKEYAARESRGGKTALELYEKVAALGGECYYYSDMMKLACALADYLKPGDLALLTGAGDVKKVSELL